MMNRFLMAIAILATVAACLAPQADAGNNEPVNPDWLKMDLAIANRLKDRLPPSAVSAAEFLKSLGAEDMAVIDLGFGNERYEGTIGGGYTSFNIKVLSRGRGMAAVRVNMYGFADTPEAEKALRELLGSMAAPYEYGLRYEYRDAARLRDMRMAVQKSLGRYERPEPGEQSGAYVLLADPFATNDVGDKCYYAGVVPDGRKAMDSLKAAGRWDLVRGALRSMSPEGRVYAALALLERKGAVDIPKADHDAIKVISGLKIDISVCNGCIVHREKASAILLE